MNELATVPVNESIIESGRALQQTRGAYSGAIVVQRPRTLAAVEKSSKQEAELLGDLAYYAWGQGKDRVEGPSVKLAMVLVRLWGNATVEMLPMQETQDAWIFTAAFLDLETGFTLQRQFRQSKDWTVYGKFDEARKEDIRFQIGQSKAARNVILNALPAWLVDRALDCAKGGVRASIEASVSKHGLETVQKKALDRLAKVGVDEATVLRVFARPTPQALTVEDLVLLHGNIRALETKADTVDALFPPAQAEQKRGVDALAERMPQPT